MSRSHVVRVGVLGQIGLFDAADATIYPRTSRVVLRTERGLETGEVLESPSVESSGLGSDGTIVRGMTVEDDLLLARLQKNRLRAQAACEERLTERGLPVVLVDVEHLFDGRTLVFYFLGPETPELEEITAELTDIYDANVQFRAFAETLASGCGPDCGTKEPGESGCSNCATGCAVAAACSTRR